MKNIQVRIRRAPWGATPEDFELVEREGPSPRKGEMLTSAQWLSLDPHVLAPRNGAGGAPALKPGDVLPARGVCEVVDSRNEIFNTGDLVVMEAGLQKYRVSDGVGVHRVRTGGAPVSAALGVMGDPGFTAWCGLVELARLARGETVLVSAAAGAVGSVAGQIARVKSCHTIGIAATAAECAWCLREAHFEACINQRTESVSARLGELAPKGVNVYFDDTGRNDLLTEVAGGGHLASGARVVLAHHAWRPGTREEVPAAIRSALADSRASALVLHVPEFESRRGAFLKDAIAWFTAGHLRYREEVVHGLEHAPEYVCRLLRGESYGETLVRT